MVEMNVLEQVHWCVPPALSKQAVSYDEQGACIIAEWLGFTSRKISPMPLLSHTIYTCSFVQSYTMYKPPNGVSLWCRTVGSIVGK